MTNKVKITDQQGTQVFPVTHVTAVIDNYGNSVEQILGAQTDLINQKQMEIGAVPIDLVPTIGNTTHVVSSDAVFQATKYNGIAVDTSGLTRIAYAIYSGSDYKWADVTKWTSPSNNRRYIMVPVTAGKSYVVRNVDGINANYTVLSSGTITAGTTPDYATGFSWSSTSVDLHLDMPSDAAYLYLQVHDNTDEIAWQVIEVGESAFAQELGNDPYKGMSQKGTTEALNSIGTEWRVFDTSDVPEMKYWLGASVWNESIGNTSNRRCKMIPIPTGSKIKLATGSYSINYGVIADAMVVSDSTANFATGFGRGTLSANSEVEFVVPSDGYALYILTKNDSSQDTTPTVYISEDKSIEMSVATHTYVNRQVGYNSQCGIIDLTSIPQTSAALGETAWLDLENRKCKFIPIKGGCCYRIIAQSGNTNFAFLKDPYFARLGTINFASGSKRERLLNGAVIDIKAPLDAKYLCVYTYITSDATPIIEIIADDDYARNMALSFLGSNTMQNGIVVSDADYKYAFLPQIMYQNNHVKAVFAGNKTTTDGDATVNTNKMVLTDYDPMTGEWTNTEMPEITSFVDNEGNIISGVTRAFNNCVFAPFGNDIAMFGLMGDGTNPTFSYGYKTTFNGTTYTRCHLVYGNTDVEFTIENYRQMLYDMGWTSSVVAATKQSVDCTAIYYYDAKYYIVMCTFAHSSYGGESVALPLVLLESTDFATWTVVKRLGNKSHNASEIRFVIKNGKVYIIYRAIYVSNTDNDTSGGNAYDICIYSLSDGSELYSTEIHTFVLSLPMCFDMNERVWFGHNEKPYIFGEPSDVSHPNGRQQMAFYTANENGDGIDYQFSIENPTGFNYPTTVTVSALTKKQGDSDRATVSSLDRIYMAWSEDRRNLNYRQIGNVTLVNITSLFL